MKTIFEKPLITIGVTLVVACCLVVATSFSKVASKVEPQPAAVKVAINDRPLTPGGSLGTSLAPIVKKVSPSVVQVNTVVKFKPRASVPDGTNPQRFFGEGPDGFRGPFGQGLPPLHGVGSGVIVTADGYILTNSHVVDGANEVKVVLLDGREFSAKVVGTDPKSDVAVLKVGAKDLPFIEIADSDQIEVGDLVLAIGNPFGIGQTVTKGIVSAMGRATMGLDYEDFIQTDAAINPGNSGGALVDAAGRLIGINTAILSRSGGNQGIGFAIPSNLAREVMDSLVKYGKVTRGYLGIAIQNLTPALAKEFKLKDQQGALIGEVVSKGPADQAGLASGDIVVEFNGKPVRDSRHLKFEVGRGQPGSIATVKVIRNGAPREFKATLQEQPGAERLARGDRPEDTGTLNGVTVMDLDRRVRRELEVPENIKGALVSEVDENSAAREAGLQAGDVIQEINHQPVQNANEAVRLTEKAKDKHTLLRIWSKGSSRYLVVDETNGS